MPDKNAAPRDAEPHDEAEAVTRTDALRRGLVLPEADDAKEDAPARSEAKPPEG